MALQINDGQGITTTFTSANNGATIPAGTGETTMIAALATGATLGPDTTVKAHGTQSIKIVPVSTGTGYARTASSGGVTASAARMLIRVPGISAPVTGSEPFLLQAVGVGGGTLYSATWVPTSGFLRQRDGSGTATTSSVAFNPSGAFLEIGMYLTIDTTTPANSTCHLAAYSLDSSTPIAGLDLGTLTKTPATSGVLFDYWKFGRCNIDPDTNPLNIGARWDNAATGLLAPASTTALACTTAVTPSAGTAPLAVSSTITATGGNGNAITYDWAWGDGATTPAQSSATATHTYSTAGSYTITGAANQT